MIFIRFYLVERFITLHFVMYFTQIGPLYEKKNINIHLDRYKDFDNFDKELICNIFKARLNSERKLS
jgi:hypothetical protein